METLDSDSRNGRVRMCVVCVLYHPLVFFFMHCTLFASSSTVFFFFFEISRLLLCFFLLSGIITTPSNVCGFSKTNTF
jgi:hypothetical protein